MKAVVIGAGGTIGQVLMKTLKEQGHEAFAFDRTKVDIEDKEAVETYLNEFNPDIVYHLGKSSLAFTERLGAWAYQQKVALLFTSSYKVFSGKKVTGPYSIFDSPDGTDAFAKDKIAQEKALFDYYPYTYIVRLAWQIDKEPKANTFLGFVKDQIEKSGTFKAAKEHYISLMFIEDTAKHLIDLPKQNPPGLYHLNANEFFSIYEVLKNLQERQTYDWLDFNDQNPLIKDETMENNITVKTFSDEDFKSFD